MNSFEQIKVLLELKEKGSISDAEFKQMLAILEAESKKEENTGGRSENLEESDDAEELEVRQKEVEQKQRAQAEQTTREIRELVQLGKIEEALTVFASFERKDLFDPKMQQLLNEKKAELDLRNKAKAEANRDKELIEQLYAAHRNKDLATAQIKFEQIKNKDVVSSTIKKELADFEKKKTDEARVEEDRKRILIDQNIRKRDVRKAYLIALGLAFIVFIFGYCSFKPTDQLEDSVPKKKENIIVPDPDTLAKSEDDAALKTKFLNHQYITTTKDARLKKAFGIVFLKYTKQGVYRRASTVLGLDKPDALIKDPKLIQLLNERFGLNVAIPVSENQEVNPKPEQRHRQQQSQEGQQQGQEQNTSAELPEFPEKYVTEAEYCKKTILDASKSAEDKKVAAERIIMIKRDYVSNINKKWKENPQILRKLNSCVTVALKN